ncbi:MAG: cysteine methyltransferase [Clostridiales bacterium]|jgi:methylated-DNA-[protein]-cysteine S-methyltransferase|nr:cysteine methyltransferase [Clostridiales bacterium]
MNSKFLYETIIGKIGIEENGSAITKIYFENEENNEDVPTRETSLIKEAAKQLNEYFVGQRRVFDIPLEAKGTVFQKKVWEALRQVPWGETKSYKEIAIMVGNEKACRAVGMANNKNPIAIVVPCHRIIGSNGKLIGYAGGLDIKERLLLLEKISKNEHK